MITVKEQVLRTQRKLTATGNHKDVELWFSIIQESFRNIGGQSIVKINETHSRAVITVFNT